MKPLVASYILPGTKGDSESKGPKWSKNANYYAYNLVDSKHGLKKGNMQHHAVFIFNTVHWAVLHSPSLTECLPAPQKKKHLNLIPDPRHWFRQVAMVTRRCVPSARTRFASGKGEACPMTRNGRNYSRVLPSGVRSRIRIADLQDN